MTGLTKYAIQFAGKQWILDCVWDWENPMNENSPSDSVRSGEFIAEFGGGN